MHGRRVQQFQRRYGLLGAVFLHRADQDVRDHHEDEQHVPVASDQQKTYCQCEVKQIEQRKHMGRYDLGNGLLV